MILTLSYLTLFGFLTYVSGENCDKLGVLLYEDMACRPEKTSSSCPISFDCGNLVAPGKCIFQGKRYSPGEPIAKNSIGLTCQFGCFCYDAGDQPSVTCAQGGCAEYSGLPPTPGCYRGYNLDYCCSSGEICPPFNDTTTCLVDGVEHKAGTRFYPKDSCHVCLCQKGWNGKYERPYCKRRGCDAQLYNQGEVEKNCAPLYITSKDAPEINCCPKTWICPDGSEVIKRGGKQSKLTCKFGEKTLHLGDNFEKEIQYLYRPKKVKCECSLPPLLTCF